MIAKVKALVAKFTAWVKASRASLTAAAGLLAQLVALGVVHGTALDIARAVLAVLTVLGVHVANKASVKAARRLELKLHIDGKHLVQAYDEAKKRMGRYQ